ncbi:MAG: hypothetical protein GY730_05310 [bacterium]|nr:hypothetical protein [bacterium]
MNESTTYLAIGLVFLLFGIFYYIGVLIRNYKENDILSLNKVVIVNGIYGLLETLIINWVIFEVIFSASAATNELDIIKQLLIAMAICLKNGYSYKETLASIASANPSPDTP